MRSSVAGSGSAFGRFALPSAGQPGFQGIQPLTRNVPAPPSAVREPPYPPEVLGYLQSIFLGIFPAESYLFPTAERLLGMPEPLLLGALSSSSGRKALLSSALSPFFPSPAADSES